MPTTPIARPQRCAIYTRKSLEDQFDKEFNSIESQRDICAAYITCQEHREWFRLPQSYDDPGQSGASLNRPALQQLLQDVESSEIDIVVPKPGAVWETFDDSNMDAQIKRTLRAAETLSRTQSWLLMPPVTE